MKKRFLTMAMCAILTVSLFAGCGQKTSETSSSPSKTNEDVIKIGVLQPVTGANAGGGQLEVNGIKLANKLYPEVLGKKVELVLVDNKSDKVESASAASRLVEKEKVSVILGSYGSSLSMSAGDIVRNAKVPAIACSATNPLVTQGNPYYFRVCFIDPFQGTVMAKFAYEKLNARKIGIVQEVSNDYSVGLNKFFIDAFKKLTGDENSIVGILNYNTGDQDFTAQLTNLKAKNPDVIFAPGNFTESALVIKQARQLGMKTPFIGGDTWEVPEFIKIGGKDVEGAAFSTCFTAEKPVTNESKKFLEAYSKEYSDDPSALAALGYDSYIFALDAIKRAGTADPEKVRDSLEKAKDFEGATGVINLDKEGNAVKEAIIKTVKDGKFMYTDTVQPEK